MLSLGLHLYDSTVREAVALKLGAHICEAHSCRCGKRVDKSGRHGISCSYSAGRFPRHANLNDVVKRALAAAGIPSWLEPVGLDRSDGQRCHRVSLQPWEESLLGFDLCGYLLFHICR